MDFLELAKTRYSVRSFEEKSIEPWKIEKTLEAGRTAPTAKNLQPYFIYDIKSDAAIGTIRKITRCAFNAPEVLLVCGKPEEGWVNPFNGRSSIGMDTGIVATHMMLQAAELGLGTTCVCWFDTEKVKQEFNLPNGMEPYCLLPIGYASKDSEPSSNHSKRKSKDETAAKL
ncbi:MAG: nitroreductase family protein [Smithella sp.]|jgi:nitroreductase